MIQKKDTIKTNLGDNFGLQEVLDRHSGLDLELLDLLVVVIVVLVFDFVRRTCFLAYLVAIDTVLNWADLQVVPEMDLLLDS